MVILSEIHIKIKIIKYKHTVSFIFMFINYGFIIKNSSLILKISLIFEHYLSNIEIEYYYLAYDDENGMICNLILIKNKLKN